MKIQTYSMLQPNTGNIKETTLPFFTDLVDALKKTASLLVAETEARLRKLCDMGNKYHHAWNLCSVQLLKCAKVFQ